MTRRFLNPTSALFATYADLTDCATALLLHSDDPALGRWLIDGLAEERANRQAAGRSDALAAGRVIALHTSSRALDVLGRVPGLEVTEGVYPDPTAHGPADVALLDIPKGRAPIRAYLWTAARVLKPGGRLYMAGPNGGGAKSAISDAADLFGGAPVLGYKSSHRIALSVRPERLVIPPDWGDPPWHPQMRVLHRPEHAYLIVTLPGVFSWDHLDDGTALLLDHLDIQPEMDVLDIGCGYGIIGLVAAYNGARVTLVDDHLLAVRCARASVEANGLAGVCEVLPSDVTGAVADRRYDLVVSNPPFHQGIDVSTSIAARMIREGYAVLRPGGRLVLVANRFLAYDHTLREVFGDVTTLVETSRYVVLESVRRDSADDAASVQPKG